MIFGGVGRKKYRGRGLFHFLIFFFYLSFPFPSPLFFSLSLFWEGSESQKKTQSKNEKRN